MKRAPYLDNRWMAFTPDAAVAAFAVMECIGKTTIDGEIVYQTTQPTTSGGDVFLVNGPVAVAANKHGVCTKAMDKPAWALYDTGYTAPSAGQGWGPDVNNWKLVPSDDGYVCVSDADTSNGVVLVLRKRARVRQAELQADYMPGDESVGVQFVYYDYGDTFTAYFPTHHRQGIGRAGSTDPLHAATQCIVLYNQSEEELQVISGQFKTTGIGKANGNIAAGGSGAISIWEKNYGTGAPDDSEIDQTMINWSNVGLVLDDLVVWFYDAQEDLWYCFKS